MWMQCTCNAHASDVTCILDWPSTSAFTLLSWTNSKSPIAKYAAQSLVSVLLRYYLGTTASPTSPPKAGESSGGWSLLGKHEEALTRVFQMLEGIGDSTTSDMMQRRSRTVILTRRNIRVSAILIKKVKEQPWTRTSLAKDCWRRDSEQFSVTYREFGDDIYRHLSLHKYVGTPAGLQRFLRLRKFM